MAPVIAMSMNVNADFVNNLFLSRTLPRDEMTRRLKPGHGCSFPKAETIGRRKQEVPD